ncbi:MAG: rhamnulokinase [Dehalococcoidia bacterium]|nr:rhamnulokinase [Dehalococcoidia bacterium]
MSGEGKTYLALDLGAESGRAIAGTFDGERLTLREVHRFSNVPVRQGESFHWDLPALFDEVKRGIAAAANAFGKDLVSVGVSTWGIDYGLLDGDGTLMGLPHQYRDPRTAGIQDSVMERLGKDFLYEQAGIQLMEMNTLYQLLSEPPERLSQASRLLFIPDLINYRLTGVMSTEHTFASTSQLYDVRKRDWAYSLLDAVELPHHMLGDIRDAGESMEPLLPEVAEETGASGVNVVLPGTHDTASAVAAVPASEGTWAFLSSGTWSLLGVETPEPVMNERAKAFELGNEVGVFGTVRPLKNISGLWLVQQCRATWEAQGNSYSYAELTRMAEASTPFAAIIDPDDPSFTPAGDMPVRIADFCARSGQVPPSTRGEVVRTILESLALRYRTVLETIEDIVDSRMDTLYIVGGGGQNLLLNQFTANAVGRPVVVGPVEATAAGNILMQMVATGEISSLAEGREIIRRSFELTTYVPEDGGEWGEAYERFQRISSPSE